MAQLDLVPNVYMICAQAALFLLALIVVRYFFLKPYDQLDQARAAQTTELMFAAEQYEKKSAANIAEVEKKLAVVVRELNIEAENERKKINHQVESSLEQAKKEGARLLAEAQLRLEQQKQEQLKQLKSKPAEIARLLMAKLSNN